ncbi:MAG TPA: SCO family protein [Saprospiraceae bacterium]|nr:SCO family protein [Saprospiraceae bacterium]HRO07852.1 SCO family protein [Saprospiraceae bacterium]HRO73874.1 SCO family protein [Saprospiraceae bacterium]HRP41250.1 SCO family protein [Saprospiraceae bacterium]
MKTFQYFPIITLLALLTSCRNSSNELPYLGNTTIVDGKSVYHTVGNIDHYNQDSVHMTNQDFKDVIYVADFFFTSCPSICPRVTKEMLRIYDAVNDLPDVKLVSFTIDPVRDTPHRLKLYADNIGADPSKWYFLTGDKDGTFALADTYFVTAYEDPDSPGGFDHSGKIILVDKEGHVRSYSEGTEPQSTPKIIEDIRKLDASYKK